MLLNLLNLGISFKFNSRRQGVWARVYLRGYFILLCTVRVWALRGSLNNVFNPFFLRVRFYRTSFPRSRSLRPFFSLLLRTVYPYNAACVYSRFYMFYRTCFPRSRSLRPFFSLLLRTVYLYNAACVYSRFYMFYRTCFPRSRARCVRFSPYY